MIIPQKVQDTVHKQVDKLSLIGVAVFPRLSPRYGLTDHHISQRSIHAVFNFLRTGVLREGKHICDAVRLPELPVQFMDFLF